MLSIGLSFAAASISLAEEIRIVTDDWTPYYGKDLQDQGFFSVIVKEAFKKAGYEPTLAFVPWKRAEETAKAGKEDVLLGAYYTKEREEFFIFSDPILGASMNAMVKKDSDIQFSGDLHDFKSLKMGKVRGYKISEEFNTADYLNVEEATTLEQNIRKLLAGRIDVLIESPIVAMDLMNHTFSQAERDSVTFIEPPIVNNDLYICFSKKRPNAEIVAKKFNAALSEMKKNGELDAIKKNILSD